MTTKIEDTVATWDIYFTVTVERTGRIRVRARTQGEAEDLADDYLARFAGVRVIAGDSDYDVIDMTDEYEDVADVELDEVGEVGPESGTVHPKDGVSSPLWRLTDGNEE